jgi:hypothetical protein
MCTMVTFETANLVFTGDRCSEVGWIYNYLNPDSKMVVAVGMWSLIQVLLCGETAVAVVTNLAVKNTWLYRIEIYIPVSND